VIHHTGYQDPALQGKKLERNLRLLQLDRADNPTDGFVLFNLGWINQQLGRPAEASSWLAQARALCQGSESVLRAIHVLQARCHRELGNFTAAVTASRSGLELFAGDVELLHEECLALRELGDATGAEMCLRQMLDGSDAPGFTSRAVGLRGYLARHQLAVLCLEQGRLAEAEAHWRWTLAEQRNYVLAWLGLGELFRREERWIELEEVATDLQKLDPAKAAALRSRTAGRNSNRNP
jgi:tetratricopeptide (TPR) repeat protein